MEELLLGLALPLRILAWFYAILIPFTAITGAIINAFEQNKR